MGRILGAATVVVAMVGTLLAGTASAARADQTTAGVDNLRTSWDRSEPTLSPAAVQSSSFGQLFRTQLDGQVYAQPLVIGRQVVAVTENNTLYSLDAATGTVSWSAHYGTPFPASAISCGDLTPSLGATATPVYDPSSSTLYFTTKVDDGTATHLHPTWLMHGVDPSTGAEKAGWPVTIQGAASNQPGVTFDPFYEQQRPGLLLLDGTVYAGFGGHCDRQPYRGYIVGVSTATHSITSLWASEAGSSTSGGGIWQAGGGLVSDGPGRIFFSTGNGISPSAGAGGIDPGTLAESVVRLAVGKDGSLSTADFFSPTDNATLDRTDKDISSGGPMALPDGYGTAAHPHLMVEQGKDGRLFLLDRDDLGGMGQGPGGTDKVLGVSGPYQGLWGHPAFYGGDGGYVYLIGNNGPLRALHVGVAGNGLPALTLAGQSQDTFGYTSGSPLVTSDGTTSGSAVLWMVSATDASGANGTLRAYAAAPDSTGLLPLLWSAPIGTAAKFATPMTAGGRVYVGTRDGFLYGFGSPANTALTASPVDFGPVGVGATASGTLHLTAAAAGGVTVTGWSAAAPFGIGANAPTAPVALAQNQTLDIPVNFAPTTTGGVNGTVAVTLSGGQKLVFALHGVGTAPGLGAAPASLDFGQVPTRTTMTMNVQLTNTGTVSETVGAVTAPTGPFTAAGLPAVGTTVPPGNAIVVSVGYVPTAGQADASSFSVTSTSGTVTVPLSGSGVVGQGHLVLSAATTDFGTVPVGGSATQTFTLTNTGNIPVTVTKAKAPTGDFNSALQLSEGLVIGPDQSAVQQVTFTPRGAGRLTASYEVTGDGLNADGTAQGEMFEQLTGVGTGTADVSDVQPASWQVNGSATLPGDGGIQLTGAAGYQAGSAFFTRPLRTEGLRATFTAQFGPGTGGDGLAFVLLDPARADPSVVGGTGSGVGISGQPAVSVVLRTTYSAAVGHANFVALTSSAPGAATPTYLASATVPAALRQGTHQVDVLVTRGRVRVSVDGVPELDSPAAGLTSAAYVGFSGGTGALNDVHAVRGVVVSGGPAAGYTPVAPVQVLSTSAGVGQTGNQPLAAGGADSLTLAGAYGVPADATAVLVGVRVQSPAAANGALTVWPHGGTRPVHGTVLWNQAGQSVQHSAVVPLGQGGAVDLVNSSGGTAHAVVNLLGYYEPGTGRGLTPVAPAYVLDTARGIGRAGTAPLAGQGTVSVAVTGRAGVPAGATAVVLDVTASAAASDGSLTVWAHGAARPAAGSLFWNRGSDAMSDLLTVPVGAGGLVDLRNAGTGGVAVNAVVVGWYGAPGAVGAAHAGPGATFVATTPSVLLDSDAGIGQFRYARLPSGGTSVRPTSYAGLPLGPSGAKAVLVELGSNGSTLGGSLTAWPDGGAVPAAPGVGWTVPGHRSDNLVLVPLNASGRVDIRNLGAAPASVFMEVLGYFV